MLNFEEYTSLSFQVSILLLMWKYKRNYKENVSNF
jgi:hypothetical protein